MATKFSNAAEATVAAEALAGASNALEEAARAVAAADPWITDKLTRQAGFAGRMGAKIQRLADKLVERESSASAE
jgi:hypothetical protein